MPGNISFDIHQTFVVIKLPTSYGGNYFSIGKLRRLINQVTILRFGNQHTSGKSDIPMTHILCGCPNIRKTFHCCRAHRRSLYKLPIFLHVSGSCFRRIDIVFVLFKSLMHIGSSRYIFLFHFCQILTEISLLQPKIVNLILFHEIMIRHFACFFNDRSQ